MFDSHIHIGQFNELYTSVETVVEFMDSVGVDGFAVASTSTCERKYDKVIQEMQDLVCICGRRAFPVLWILPEMFENDAIGQFLDTGINWRMLKIHPQASPAGSWETDSTNTAQLISLAKILKLPILIHTGENAGCYPEQFRDAITANLDIKFILAHGRPLEQTMAILKDCPNAWCDTAFMPTENIVRLYQAGLTDKVLWGTDYPIPKYYYPKQDMKQYYYSILSKLKDSVSAEAYDKMTDLNARRLFSI